MEIFPTVGLAGPQRSCQVEPPQPALDSGGFAGKAGAGSVFGGQSPRGAAGEARPSFPRSSAITDAALPAQMSAALHFLPSGLHYVKGTLSRS